MIAPPHGQGRVVFSEASDGDLRADMGARLAFSRSLGINSKWATINQVHGSTVVEASSGGGAGVADALWTRLPGLPLAIFTADCYAVVLQSADAVGVAHAGWRGAAEDVVDKLMDTMTAAGFRPERALIGPGIGACCFEVGNEVVELFPDATSRTRWDTASVDLPQSIRGELADLKVWSAGVCTLHDPGWFSHRADGTAKRLAAVAWI